MKCTYGKSIAFTYITAMLGVASSAVFLMGSCRALYKRSLHALIIRKKYRSCVDTLRARATIINNTNQERSFVVLNRSGMYLRESMETYMRCHGYHDLLAMIYTTDLDVKNVHVKEQEKNTKVKQSPPSSMLFTWPLKRGSFWVSSFFGPRKRGDGSNGFHTGIDLAALKGTPVYAARSGVVVQAYYANGYGKTIIIQHGKTFKTRYAHLHKMYVSPGDWVRKNSIIGEVGDTGFTRKEGKDGSHLHFEVYEHEKRVNPMQFLPNLV